MTACGPAASAPWAGPAKCSWRSPTKRRRARLPKPSPPAPGASRTSSAAIARQHRRAHQCLRRRARRGRRRDREPARFRGADASAVGWHVRHHLGRACAAHGPSTAATRAGARGDRCAAAAGRLVESSAGSARVITLLPGMQIDFGGIGKEYAVDQAMQLAAQTSDAAGARQLRRRSRRHARARRRAAVARGHRRHRARRAEPRGEARGSGGRALLPPAATPTGSSSRRRAPAAHPRSARRLARARRAALGDRGRADVHQRRHADHARDAARSGAEASSPRRACGTGCSVNRRLHQLRPALNRRVNKAANQAIVTRLGARLLTASG